MTKPTLIPNEITNKCKKIPYERDFLIRVAPCAMNMKGGDTLNKTWYEKYFCHLPEYVWQQDIILSILSNFISLPDIYNIEACSQL